MLGLKRSKESFMQKQRHENMHATKKELDSFSYLKTSMPYDNIDYLHCIFINNLCLKENFIRNFFGPDCCVSKIVSQEARAKNNKRLF